MPGKNRIRQVKLGCMLGERMVKSEERCHGATARDRCAEILLVGHDLMVIYRLIEMG